jgi:selenocysteine lyase/cysteine desulfurase
MITRQFNNDIDLIHLNHARLSPWPQCTREAVIHFTETMQYATPEHAKQWYETEQQVRTKLARLLHAPSADQIALLKNISEALCLLWT